MIKRAFAILLILVMLITVLAAGGCNNEFPAIDADGILKARTGGEISFESGLLDDNSEMINNGEIEDFEIDSDYVLTDDEQQIAKKAKEYMDTLDFTGTVLLAVGDNIVYKEGFGYANKERKTANTVSTVYQIASLTKQFTAAAVIKLQEQGKLNINDSIKKYFPDYKYADKITISNLLCMTSGIKDFADSYILDSIKADESYETGYVFDKVKDFELNFATGSYYKYSNTDYYMLGMIIEQASGMKYEEYMEKNIFKPLKMHNTGFDTSKVTSTGYIWGVANDVIYDKSIFYSAGAICSTAEDMFRWLRGLNRGNVVNEESLKYIRSNVTKLGYNCGWTVGTEGRQHHSGNLSGFRTYDIISYKNDVIAVVLSNSEQTLSNVIGNQLVDIANNILG